MWLTQLAGHENVGPHQLAALSVHREMDEQIDEQIDKQIDRQMDLSRLARKVALTPDPSRPVPTL